MFRKLAGTFLICFTMLNMQAVASCVPVQGVLTVTETGCGWFRLHLEILQGSNIWVQWTFNGSIKKGSNDTIIYVGDKVPFSYSIVCGNECSYLPFSGNLISQYKKPLLMGAVETKTGCNEFNIAFQFRGQTSDMKCRWYLDGQIGDTYGTSLSHTFFQPGTYPYSVEFVNACNEHYKYEGKIVANDFVTCHAGSDFAVCFDQNKSALIGTPAGGCWKGDGIQGDAFNATLAGAGKHNLIYIYAKNGCRSSDTLVAEVIKPDAAAFIQSSQEPAPAPVKFQILTQDSSYRYTWHFGDQTFSDAPQPIHIYNQSGTYFPSLDIYDELTGCHQALSLQPLIISKPLVFSSKTVEFENHLNISPNPASGYLRISTDLDITEETYRIQLCDLSGVILRESDVLTGNYFDLYIPPLSSGCYIVRLISATGNQYTRKIVGLK